MEILNSFPIKLKPTRAWRTYIGGKMIDCIHGEDLSKDGHFPEEWIMSLVCARNIGREHIHNEGLSQIYNSDIYLKNLINNNAQYYLGERHTKTIGNSLGVLVKLLDSAERLTIQVHPTKEKAKELFNSLYGKTECWHILSGRTIDGVKPCIYIGFKKGITREMWEQLFLQQDYDGMLNVMNKIEVKEGETYLIKGGVPHAIGSGCFLVEIQEPTDYTIRVEKVTPSGFEINDFLCHQGLGFNKMFDCFNYEGVSLEEAKKLWCIQPKVLQKGDGYEVISLIDYNHTEMFKMNLIKVQNEMSLKLPNTFSGIYVLEGSGTISNGHITDTIKKGDQFFIPYNCNNINIITKENLKIVHFFGPK